LSGVLLTKKCFRDLLDSPFVTFVFFVPVRFAQGRLFAVKAHRNRNSSPMVVPARLLTALH
jgi:hypothetical protein